MGACQSKENVHVDKQQLETATTTSINEHELHKAKKVIDSLNSQIDGLEQEMIGLRRLMSKERQKKEEESSRLHRAEQTISKMEDERAKLKVKLMRIAVANRKSIDEDEMAALKEEMAHDEDEREAHFGECQSPINIISITPPVGHGHGTCGNGDEQTVPLTEDDFSANGLKFNYPEKVKHCTIINNGHTVQVNIPASAKCKLSIYEKEYDLKQFHFHTPSEHTVNNEAFEMEMHLVHINEANEICVLGFMFTTRQKYEKPRLKLTKSRAHLIVAQHKKSKAVETDDESDDLETDDEWDDDEDADKDADKDAKKGVGNDFLDQFWDQLPPNKTEKEILLKQPLSFDYLFETASKSVSKNVKSNEIEINMDIFEYVGSLTTPPFTEGVQWLLSKTTHFINDEQLQRLSACWNNENNARAVQKYFGRQVSLRSKSSLRVVT